MILLPKLKPGSPALEISGERFVCLFFNLLSYFSLFKRAKTLSIWSGLNRLVPYGSGGTRAAGGRLPGKSKEVRKHQLFQEITCPCTFPHVQASILWMQALWWEKVRKEDGTEQWAFLDFRYNQELKGVPLTSYTRDISKWGLGLQLLLGQMRKTAGKLGFCPRFYLPDPRAGPGLNWQVV